MTGTENSVLRDPADFGSRDPWKKANAHAVQRWAEKTDTAEHAKGSGCSESHCYAEGDHVEVIDGSEAHGDRGRILYQQKNGIIVVELYNGACWPVEANEVRKLHNE